MRTADAVTTPGEILERHARPQQQSTWVPYKRDWRYETGVFQHEDWNDDPRSRTVWDWMDYDYQYGFDADIASQAPSYVTAVDDEGGNDSPREALGTPLSAKSSVLPSNRSRNKKKQKSPPLPKNRWMMMLRYRALVEDGATSYEPVSLMVRLRFNGHCALRLQQILIDEDPHDPLSQSADVPVNPTHRLPPIFHLYRKSDTYDASTRLASGSGLSTPVFKRTWVDETRDFDMKEQRDKLASIDAEWKDYGERFQWYSDATPVDAIFPPGVPLSMREIMAFYPHHVRWKGVMLRLVHNNFRGADILGIQRFFRGNPARPISIQDMGRYQRDIVKATIPTFNSTKYEGISDYNLFTDGLARGNSVDYLCKRYILPSFDDLLRGLQHFPTGIDARGLTQCLVWYSQNHKKFTPSLQLNVLHTQSLVRALRQPVRSIGTQNLDRNTLQAWREKGTFEEAKVEASADTVPAAGQQYETIGRCQLHMNLDNHTSMLNYKLPLRHVFTFPFMAMHNIVEEAFQLGINKAEARQAEKEAEATKKSLIVKLRASPQEARNAVIAHQEQHVGDDTPGIEDTLEEGATQDVSKPTEKRIDINAMRGYRIPKRPRPSDEDEEPPVLSAPLPAAPRAMLPPHTLGTSHILHGRVHPAHHQGRDRNLVWQREGYHPVTMETLPAQDMVHDREEHMARTYPYQHTAQPTDFQRDWAPGTSLDRHNYYPYRSDNR